MARIQDINLFHCLPDDVADRLDQRCRWNKYGPNQLVIDYDDTSSDVWFLSKGRARVQLRTESGKELVLQDMKPGDLFGEMSALDGLPRSANITTLEDSELGRMSASEFMTASTTVPDLAKALFCHFTGRIRNMNSQVREATFMTNRQRLCAELMRRAKPRMANPDQLIISPPPLHQELADRLGCMREAVTREMSTLRKKGMIENARGGCVITEPEKVNRFIAGL
ncbi:MAG: Crp/Fnr family transcriptional regulator [Pseudomonadota bacterium]